MNFPKGYRRQLPEHCCLDCKYMSLNIMQMIRQELRCMKMPRSPIVEKNAICDEWKECEEWDCDKESG